MIRRGIGCLVATAALVLTGCGESRLTAQLRDEVAKGRLDRAKATVEDLYGSDSDQALIKHMELGVVSHLAGDFATSAKELDGAAPLVDDLRSARVADAVATAVINDTHSAYTGRPFEHTQVDAYRTLGNLLSGERLDGRWMPGATLVTGVGGGLPPLAPAPSRQDDAEAGRAYEKAIITARRMTINQLKETADAADGKRYDDDPFARVLAAIAVLALPPKARTESDLQFANAMLARAEAVYAAQEKALGRNTAIARYECHGIPEVVTTLRLRHLRTYDPELFALEVARRGLKADDPRWKPAPGSGGLLVLNHVGFVTRPQPLQIGLAAVGFASPNATTFSWGAIGFYAKGPGRDICREWPVLPIPGDIVQKCLAPGGAAVIGFELPAHAPDTSINGPATLRVGQTSQPCEVVCDLDAYARTALADEQPHLLLKTLTRVAVKQAAVAIGSHAIGNRGGNEAALLAFLFNLLGSAAATATESADLRAWVTLPDHIEASLVDLPAGTYPVSLADVDGSHDLGQARIDAGRLTVVSLRTIPSHASELHALEHPTP